VIVAVATAVYAAETLAVRPGVDGYASRTHVVDIGVRDRWVIVDGDRATDLDCWIYDWRGYAIDSDTDSTDYCLLRTRGVGRYRVVIENPDSLHHRYELRRSE
jgi:hypothetical protein